jgi:hypothetical protein
MKRLASLHNFGQTLNLTEFWLDAELVKCISLSCSQNDGIQAENKRFQSVICNIKESSELLTLKITRFTQLERHQV